MRNTPQVRPASFMGWVPHLGLLLALLWITGCGSSTGTLSGKVTVGDKPVDGTLKFVPDPPPAKPEDRDASISADGQYIIKDLKPGTYKIGVKGYPQIKDVGAPADLKAGQGKAPEKDDKVSKADKGVPPPKKYEDPNASGLKVEVKAGSQTHNITLTP